MTQDHKLDHIGAVRWDVKWSGRDKSGTRRYRLGFVLDVEEDSPATRYVRICHLYGLLVICICINIAIAALIRFIDSS